VSAASRRAATAVCATAVPTLEKARLGRRGRAPREVVPSSRSTSVTPSVTVAVASAATTAPSISAAMAPAQGEREDGMIGSKHGHRMAAERSKDMLAEAARQRLAATAAPERDAPRSWWVRLFAALRSGRAASSAAPPQAGRSDVAQQDSWGDRRRSVPLAGRPPGRSLERGSPWAERGHVRRSARRERRGRLCPSCGRTLAGSEERTWKRRRSPSRSCRRR